VSVEKGVIVCDAGDTVVVEERLDGQEASIQAFVDARTIPVLNSTQDPVPMGDGHTGPNAGSMGAYSPAPIVTDSLMSHTEREILFKAIKA
jgi:phosphoribosylamine---glycine ligase